MVYVLRTDLFCGVLFYLVHTDIFCVLYVLTRGVCGHRRWGMDSWWVVIGRGDRVTRVSQSKRVDRVTPTAAGGAEE